MKINIMDYLPYIEEKKPATGKIVLKTVLLTTAVLAFVPTVFKINKGKGFDAYGILSHLKYEKKTNEEGNAQHEISLSLVDLERYGVIDSNDNEDVQDDEAIEIEAVAVEAVEEDENSSCIEE